MSAEAWAVRRVISEKRHRFDAEFREGAVRIVREADRSIAQVARDLGVDSETLCNWVKRDKIERGEVEGPPSDDKAELVRLRSENAEMRMERHALKRSVVLWMTEATR